MDTLRQIVKRLRPPPSLRVQILSDLHLEVGQQYSSYTFPATAPFLLLAGDIGRLVDYDGYLQFLKAQVLRYQQVFLVLGNHEFYGLSYEAGLETAQRLASEAALADRLVLLHRRRWDDPGSRLTILGCTLWSDVAKDAYSIVESTVQDFKRIDGWTVQKHCDTYAEEAAWLREQVAQVAAGAAGAAEEAAAASQDDKRQLLVVTHHAPCLDGTSRPEHASNPWTSAFATDLLGQESWDGSTIWAWVFGHTHYSTDFVRNGIRVVANQRGYVFPRGVAQKKASGRKKGVHEFDDAMGIA